MKEENKLLRWKDIKKETGRNRINKTKKAERRDRAKEINQ
jgi:hypothetical protein